MLSLQCITFIYAPLLKLQHKVCEEFCVMLA
jgi:hypothetical protein